MKFGLIFVNTGMVSGLLGADFDGVLHETPNWEDDFVHEAKVLESRKDREQAVSLLAEGFDMLEEDFEEERFFATVRRSYWAAPDKSPMRALCEYLIGKLDF